MSNVQKIMIVIASVMVVIAAVMLFKTLREYKVANDEYADLSKYVTAGRTTMQTPPSPDAQTESGEGEAEEEAEAEIPKFTHNANRGDFPDMGIDFASLKAINPEVVAWVYAGSVDVSYPVVQKRSDHENEYYLHHTLEDKENSSGCIFMDWESEPDLSSWNTFIYGHNMKNGSMFGSLKKLIANHKLFDKDPYIYIFKEDGIYRYKIYAFYLDTPESKMYYTCKTLKEYRAYVRTAREYSVYDTETPANEEKNTVTLVTCSGSGAGKKRFFVHGISWDCYLYDRAQ